MTRLTATPLIAMLTALLAFACSKDNNGPGDGNGSTGLKGKLLYTFSGTVSELDLETNDERVFFTYNTYGFGHWYMGHDYQYRLTSEREPGVYDATKFTLVKNADGIITKEFDYIEPYGNGTGLRGQLSPDNSKALIEPTLTSGVVITDLDGHHLHHFEGITVGGTAFALELGDEALWLPDNSVLFTLANRYILKSSPPYTQVSLVREMPYTQWGNLAVSHDGTQLAMQLDLHIHVMNLDGGEPVQVTTSKGIEASAQFSPDGKHLVVEKKYGDISYFNLAIVPNDGNLHDMDTGDEVIVVQPNGENIPSAVSGAYFWVP